MASDLIERLKKCALGSADEDVMVRWDKIRAILKQDKGGTWPRDCFESIIDAYAEDCEDAVKEITALRTALAIERERAEKAEVRRNAHHEGELHAIERAKAAEAALAEAKRLLVETQRQMFGLYQAINPHAYYTTGEGIAMNRFADADTTVQQVRRFLAQEEGR